MLYVIRFLTAVAVALCLLSPADAARVSPMIVELEPTGRASIARVELINDGQKDIPYEVQMMRGEISPQGELSLTPADAEFIVFPPQAMVESNSQQVFRVQYVGEEAMDRSQVYYMTIRQVPVEFEPGTSQIQIVVNYNVMVNVAPDGTRPEAVILSAHAATRMVPGPEASDAPETDAAETPTETPIEPEMIAQHGIEVDASNIGDRFYLAGFSEWELEAVTVDGEPFSRTYKGDEASRAIGVGIVGPDARRVFFIPTDVQLREGSVKARIKS